MLPTIVFGLALLFTNGWLNGLIACIIAKKDGDNYDVFIFFTAVFLWSWLFYLLH